MYTAIKCFKEYVHKIVQTFYDDVNKKLLTNHMYPLKYKDIENIGLCNTTSTIMTLLDVVYVHVLGHLTMTLMFLRIWHGNR